MEVDWMRMLNNILLGESIISRRETAAENEGWVGGNWNHNKLWKHSPENTVLA